MKIDKGKKLSINLSSLFMRSTSMLLDQKSFFSLYSIDYSNRWLGNFSLRAQEKVIMRKELKMHEGIDIGARAGTPIVSTADGVVIFSGKKPGFGNFIKIRHGYGVETIYAHAKNFLFELEKR